MDSIHNNNIYYISTLKTNPIQFKPKRENIGRSLRKWICYRKHDFRICKGEKLNEFSWKEIERDKNAQEEIPQKLGI
jgi:hypothetical protein